MRELVDAFAFEARVQYLDFDVERRQIVFDQLLALLLERHGLSSRVAVDLAVSLPALFAGSALGILAFRNINENGFRRTILVLLLISGASLAFA